MGSPAEQQRVERVRGAIAGHLQHCADRATAYYYTINGDYRHPFSIANRCVTQVTIAERWRCVAGKLSLARAGGGKRGEAGARRQQVKQSRRR